MQNMTWMPLKAPKNHANRFRPRLPCGVIRLMVISLLLLSSYRFRYVLFDKVPPPFNLDGIEAGKTCRVRIPLNICASGERSGLGTFTAQINHGTPKHLNLLNGEGEIHTIWTLDTTVLREG